MNGHSYCCCSKYGFLSGPSRFFPPLRQLLYLFIGLPLTGVSPANKINEQHEKWGASLTKQSTALISNLDKHFHDKDNFFNVTGTNQLP
jgi:hypothetical protein